MPGFDPAFVARTGDAWFGPDEDAARWREWWRQPPVTPEKEAVYAELAALERDVAAGGGDAADWAPRLRRVSEALLGALTMEFGEDAGALASGAATWLAALNRLLGDGGVPLRWGSVFPGQRFDPDAMDAIDSLSGNRLIVHRPVSWVVRDLSGSKARVALRARVITA